MPVAKVPTDAATIVDVCTILDYSELIFVALGSVDEAIIQYDQA